MKYLLGFCFFAIGFQVQAADTTLGTVIAVEREITNVKDSCLKNVKEFPETKGNFACSIRYLKDHEFTHKRGSLLRHETSDCATYVDNSGGALLINFKSKVSKTAEAAQACLQEGLSKKGEIKVVLFTVQ